KLRQLEEVVLRFLLYRRSAGDCRARVDQLRRGIGGTTGLTVITVLVISLALGAGALDEPIRQEHLLLRVEKLGDLAGRNMPVFLQLTVDVLREELVFFRVSRMVVVELDMEAGKVFLMLLTNPVNQLFRGNTLTLCPQHDRSSVA